MSGVGLQPKNRFCHAILKNYPDPLSLSNQCARATRISKTKTRALPMPFKFHSYPLRLQTICMRECPLVYEEYFVIKTHRKPCSKRLWKNNSTRDLLWNILQTHCLISIASNWLWNRSIVPARFALQIPTIMQGMSYADFLSAKTTDRDQTLISDHLEEKLKVPH